MITQLPLNSTTITIDRYGDECEVLLAGQPVGTFEISPVWCLLDYSCINKAKSLGLTFADKCYIYNEQVFGTHIQAAAQLVADHLSATAYWEPPI
jgi:hypothetical protein